MDRDRPVCPVCGQPVRIVVVARHKTLGAWVPVWKPGPCENPDCAAYGGERAEPDASPEEHGAAKES
ncbi:hypothetical protein [Streptomyces sp. NPDC020996]|uniref:hypothetical protein n=1 Tax=Streptomyces sp. NPDC020996 TaxID=3154791 RepID=UPI0033C60D2C